MTNARPVSQIRLGAIRASIWANETPTGARYNVTMGRLYQKDGEWKTSSSFGQDELLVLCKALDLAYMWIAEQRASRPNNVNREGEQADVEPEPYDVGQQCEDEGEYGAHSAAQRASSNSHRKA